MRSPIISNIAVSFVFLLVAVGCSTLDGLGQDLSKGADTVQRFVLNIVDTREATPADQDHARAKANEVIGEMDDEQQAMMKQDNTYVAVPVSTDESGNTEVMVVDSESGKPVNDTVYVIDNSDSAVREGDKVDLGGYDAVYVE